MRVAIGADHAGFPLKEDLAGWLRARDHEVIDLGTHDASPVDYPLIARLVGQAVATGEADRGVLVCGSGVGVSVAANKIPGVRAALCHDTYSAHQGVEHDDMNVLALGAWVVGRALARDIMAVFLAARFDGQERHIRRRDQVNALEAIHLGQPHDR